MALAHAEVLFFDVFGTVVDWVSTVTEELQTTIKAAPHPDRTIQQGLLGNDWHEFCQKWRQGYREGTRDLAKRGNPDGITVDEMHRDILERLVSEVPHLAEAWDDEVLTYLNSVWHRLRPWRDSCDGLRELKRQFRVGTLSNGNLALMVNMSKAADLSWDFLLTADLLKAFKPESVMYIDAMNLLGLDPAAQAQSAVMVAAHLYDLQAAKSHGMTTCFVRRRSEDALPAIKPDYVDVVVEDLVHLSEIAGGLPMA